MNLETKRVMEPLAIDGGTPVATHDFAPWPSFTPEEVEAASAVLRSGKISYWTGEEGRRFEQEYAAHTNRRFAIALANGTVALELALALLDIGPGDEVIVPSRTFIATASCAVMRGARPVCADVDRDSGNLTAATIAPVITPRTRAIVAVHLAGWPCDMDAITHLAREHGIKVIEDCAQAHGATYKGRPVGSLGDIAAFSFCQDKIITTGGEGGMLVTDDEGLWSRGWSYKDHGKSFDAVYRREHPPGFRWLHESFGTNWRLTEMQSVLGRLQLHNLPASISARRRNATRLAAAFADIPALRVPIPAADFGNSYYKFYAYVRPERLRAGWTRDRILHALSAEGVPVFSGSCSEIYLEKAFPDEWRPAQRLPVSRELGETSLMFMVHPTLTDADLAAVTTAVSKVMRVAA